MARPTALLLFFLMTLFPGPGSTVRAQGRGPAPVEVSPVVIREANEARSFVGTVRAIRQSLVSADVQGRVVEFLVRAGDEVEEDQVLVRLRTRYLDLQIAEETARLTLRREELAQLENGTRKEVLTEARMRLKAARAEVEYWHWRVERTRKLYEQKTISLDDHRQAVRQSKRAEATAEAVEAEVARLEAGPRAEEIAQARARVAAQKETIKRLEDERERYAIRAPFAGYVTAEHTEKGQWLAPGSPVVQLVDLHRVEITVPVPEDQIRRLEPGSRAGVLLEAFPEQLFEGTLLAIVPSADARTRTFPVRIGMKNPGLEGGPFIRQGMIARVSLPVGDAGKALFVPKDGLVLSGGRASVYVVAPGGEGPPTARPVPVEVGSAVSNWIQVRGALKAGQKIVVLGNERLFPGQPLRVTREVPPPAELKGE